MKWLIDDIRRCHNSRTLRGIARSYKIVGDPFSHIIFGFSKKSEKRGGIEY
jgi:hypothetical protein